MTRKDIEETGQDLEKVIADSDKCIYCGKNILDVPKDELLYTKAITRYFPVCSETCADEVNKYVNSDKKHKTHFYWLLIICALLTTVGAIENIPIVAFAGVTIFGFAFLIFPYPITAFETFTNFPIKKTLVLIRIIGIIILVAGLFFLYMTIYGHLAINFNYYEY